MDAELYALPAEPVEPIDTEPADDEGPADAPAEDEPQAA